MEGLLGILVGMVVLFSTFTNLFKKLTPQDEGEFTGRKQEDARRQEIDRRIEESLQGLPEEESPRLSPEVSPEEGEPDRTAGSEMESFKGTGKELTGRQSRLQRDRKTAQDTLKGDLDQDLIGERSDLIRGIVFKEILDRPRARRPYRPPYRR